MADHKQSSQRRYPPELRERAVRMVFEAYEQSGERFGVITRVASQLGIGTESLRNWARQAEIDRGVRGGHHHRGQTTHRATGAGEPRAPSRQ